MNFIAFVGPALRLFGRARAVVGRNPKTSGALATLIGAGAAWFGLRPEDMAAVGKALVTAGDLIQRVAGGM